MTRSRLCALALAVLLVGSACSGPADEPTTTPTTSASAAEPVAPADLLQPEWRPSTVESLPYDEDSPLPQTLDLPRRPSAARPDAPTVVAAYVDGLVSELHASGEWSARTPPEQSAPMGSGLAISPDGSVLAYAGASALWTAVDGGGWTSLAYPDDVERVHPGSTSEWAFRLVPADDGSVLLEQERIWQSDGSAALVEVDADAIGRDRSVAPDGRIVSVSSVGRGRKTRQQVIEADGPVEAERTLTRNFDSLSRPVASAGSIAAEWYPFGRRPVELDVLDTALVAVRRGTLEPRAVLPMGEVDYDHRWEPVVPVGWLDEDTVLAEVPHYLGTNDRAVVHLVSWDVATGDVRRVSSTTIASLSWTDLVFASAALLDAGSA